MVDNLARLDTATIKHDANNSVTPLFNRASSLHRASSVYVRNQNEFTNQLATLGERLELFKQSIFQFFEKTNTNDIDASSNKKYFSYENFINQTNNRLELINKDAKDILESKHIEDERFKVSLQKHRNNIQEALNIALNFFENMGDSITLVLNKALENSLSGKSGFSYSTKNIEMQDLKEKFKNIMASYEIEEIFDDLESAPKIILYDESTESNKAFKSNQSFIERVFRNLLLNAIQAFTCNDRFDQMTDEAKKEIIDERPIAILLDESFKDGIDYINFSVINYAWDISEENFNKVKSILETGSFKDESGAEINSFSTKASFRDKNYQGGNGLQSIHEIVEELKGSIKVTYDNDFETIRVDVQIPDLIGYQRELLTENSKNF